MQCVFSNSTVNHNIKSTFKKHIPCLNLGTYRSYAQQRGIILAVVLLFLLVLTGIGVAGIQTTSVNEKLTHNLRDTTTAFNVTEAALSDGENWIKNQNTAPGAVDACKTPPCPLWERDILGNVYQKNASWWQNQGSDFTSTIQGIAQQPQWVIEEFSFVPYDLSTSSISSGKGYYYYTVNARGVGLTSHSLIYLQSIYCTRYN